MAKTNIAINRKGLSNITQKEFMDHIKGGKFIIVFIIFLLLSSWSLLVGIGEYHSALGRYKDHIVRIAEDDFDDMGGFTRHWMPERPPVLSAFMMMSMAMPILGAILAIIMGFDLISKERQNRTLKTLLSHPIYRDEIINGKAIGGMLTIIVAIGVTLAISIAILLISNIVPTIHELLSIGLFGIISVIMLVSFFSIALMASVLFKSSGISILFALSVIIVIGLILPLVGTVGAGMIVGPSPEPPEMHYSYWPGMRMPPPGEGIDIPEGQGEQQIFWEVPFQPPPMDPALEREWRIKSAAHWDRRRAVTEAFAMLDPGTHFRRISVAFDFGMGFGLGVMVHVDVGEDPDIFDKLGAVWMNILALFIIPTVFFAVAYTKFMRLDIR